MTRQKKYRAYIQPPARFGNRGYIPREAINVRRDRVVTTSVVQGPGKRLKSLLEAFKLILILRNLSRLTWVAPRDSEIAVTSSRIPKSRSFEWHKQHVVRQRLGYIIGGG